MPTSPRSLGCQWVIGGREASRILSVFEDSHDAAETTAGLHDHQIRIILVGAFREDCDESLENWQ